MYQAPPSAVAIIQCSVCQHQRERMSIVHMQDTLGSTLVYIAYEISSTFKDLGSSLVSLSILFFTVTLIVSILLKDQFVALTWHKLQLDRILVLIDQRLLDRRSTSKFLEPLTSTGLQNLFRFY